MSEFFIIILVTIRYIFTFIMEFYILLKKLQIFLLSLQMKSIFSYFSKIIRGYINYL
jgi:hypothetical protein